MCRPQLCGVKSGQKGDWGAWSLRDGHGGFVLRSCGRPMGPCRETQIHPDRGTEEGVSQANFMCFLVFPRIRPAFWSLLGTQVPVSALSETVQMCPWQNLSSFPSPSFGQMVEWFSYGTSVSDSETEARDGEYPGQEESPSTPWEQATRPHPSPSLWTPSSPVTR